MRPFQPLTRRAWLARTLRTALSALAAWWAPRRRAWGASKEIDYFTGTEWVGKNRSARFETFYINYWQPMRRIHPERWTLEVSGRVARPGRFTLEELRAFPRRRIASRLKCVECWSARAVWTGFAFDALARRVAPHPEAAGVLFHCADEYTEYLSLETLRHPRTLLATHMDGAELSDEHGFPLRVIAPMKYGYKNPKAIVRMEFVEGERWGTWSRIGPYSPDGTILPGTDHPLDLGKTPHRIPGGEITGY